MFGGTKGNRSPIGVKADKIGEQAVQNWCLLKCLPIVLLDKLKDTSNEVWQLFLVTRNLQNLRFIICTPSITARQVTYLKILIDKNLELAVT